MEDRRSQGHDVFLWILLVVYKEPVSKYYWSNFKVGKGILRNKPSRVMEVLTSSKGWAECRRQISGRKTYCLAEIC